ncbi:cytochrome c oxidase subunit 4 isoform 1, mitochondrial, partial [Biomphalaria glabrata]
MVVLNRKFKYKSHSKIGNRGVFGFGINGLATYVDRCELVPLDSWKMHQKFLSSQGKEKK